MVLILIAVIGFVVGYRLGITLSGYVTMALTTVASGLGQIVLLFVTRDRAAMTMLPLVMGLALVLFMLFGALARLAVRRGSNAA
jgi:hypothetical protein